MSYDPKAKRPVAEPAEDDDEPAPVDQLLGAAPPAEPAVADPTPVADDEPEVGAAESSADATEAAVDDHHLTFDPRPQSPRTPSFPEPEVASRTPKAIAAAVVALIVLFIGWRRRH